MEAPEMSYSIRDAGGLPDRRTVASGLGLCFVVVALGLAVVLVAPGLLGAETSYVVQTDSMSPAIDAGDVIVLTAVDTEAIDRGTVVTFTASSGSRVTHRVVGVEETASGVRYQTQGDANPSPDPDLVAPSQVIGAVWFSIPLLGYLVSFANSTVGMLALVVLPAIALAVSELYDLYVGADTQGDDGPGGETE